MEESARGARRRRKEFRSDGGLLIGAGRCDGRLLVKVVGGGGDGLHHRRGRGQRRRRLLRLRFGSRRGRFGGCSGRHLGALVIRIANVNRGGLDFHCIARRLIVVLVDNLSALCARRRFAHGRGAFSDRLLGSGCFLFRHKVVRLIAIVVRNRALLFLSGGPVDVPQELQKNFGK